MRHVRLIPEEVLRVARDWNWNPPSGEMPPAFARFGIGGFGEVVTARDGRHSCRCCGYPIAKGERVRRGWFTTKTRSYHDAVIHAEPCHWGAAHENEPPDRQPIRAMPPEAVAARARSAAAQGRRRQRRKPTKQEEEWAARSGPVTVRYVAGKGEFE